MNDTGVGNKSDLSTFYSTEGFNYNITPFDKLNSPTFKSQIPWGREQATFELSNAQEKIDHKELES